MSNVAIYVVDLKRVEPLGTKGASSLDPRTATNNGIINRANGGREHVRRSFAKGKPGVSRCVHFQETL
jgi:hypothetical protein